ncbi:hypothetical protein N836_26745 [Leptolyngbya sp. Heron Island J]|nr:hypothetical protein N836_26745 [Leptolyngbya sp. Heron Island J]
MVDPPTGYVTYPKHSIYYKHEQVMSLDFFSYESGVYIHQTP